MELLLAPLGDSAAMDNSSANGKVRMQNRAALLIASAAVATVLSTAAPADPLASDLPRMGAFQDNRPYTQSGATISAQREAGMEAWERMLDRPKDSLIAEDFYGDGSNTWAGMTAPVNGLGKPGEWAAANPKRKLIWSIPLTMPGASLAEVAEGKRDAEFRAAAGAIAASQPDAIIRIGWEMNGSWMAWYAGAGREQNYIDAYRRVAAIFRAASSRFAFDWCVSFGRQNGDAEAAYPGDDVVDTIGMDVYDFIPTASPIADPSSRWNRSILDGDGRGLTWLASFAASRNKKMSIAEWGVGLTDDPKSPVYRRLKDNPTFVRLMRSWLVANARNIAFQIYFDAPPNRIDDGTFPGALAELKKDFADPARP
jgi:Glycosyl hydrolase family 26